MKVSGLFMRLTAVRLGLPVAAGLFVLLAGVRLGFVLRERLRLDSELSAARQAIAVQEVLFPLYVELQGTDYAGDWSSLAVPGPRLLDEAAVLATPEMFRRMAEAHGLELAPVLFGVETENGLRRLHVELPMRGSYRQFGALLDEVVRMDALISLERIAALHEDEQDVIRLELKLGLE